MKKINIFVIALLLIVVLLIFLNHVMRRGFTGKITGCGGNVHIVDLKFTFSENVSEPHFKIVNCNAQEIIIYKEFPQVLELAENSKGQTIKNSSCFEILKGLKKKGYLYIFVNNCNNGVLCIWNSLADFKIGDLEILKRHSETSVEFLKNNLGDTFAQEAEGNYASDVPINETFSINGKIENQKFIISYKKIKIGKGHIRKKKDLKF